VQSAALQIVEKSKYAEMVNRSAIGAVALSCRDGERCGRRVSAGLIHRIVGERPGH
jgi:hypothetical protein